MYQPFLIAGSILAVIGAGLIYTFNLDSRLGLAISYQIIFGLGIGVVIQIPVIVAGAVSAMEDKAVALSTVLGKLISCLVHTMACCKPYHIQH